MTTLLTMKGFNKTVTPITTAGIYHNPDLGLISLSSDGTNWITIADKNLGATQVYNDGDALSEANCGKYYQWGNNYGFPRTGAVTTSSTQVYASTYGPGNYYSSSTFITGNFNWDSSNNGNLWGGVTGTNEAMQGPCDSSYHIPKNSELLLLSNILKSLLGETSTSLSIYLKAPIAGLLNYQTGGQTSLNSIGEWMGSECGTNHYSLFDFLDTGTFYYAQNGRVKGTGANIRPFANTPVQPDDGGDWETLYTPPEPLNFTANTAGSTIKLNKVGSPTAVTLETSTDGINWSTYTMGDVITLSNIGDKIYFRNTSETTTGFSTGSSAYYYFKIYGNVSGSGDITTLINKNGTDTLSSQCFRSLFINCTGLVSTPKLLATNLGQSCYQQMFIGCTNLETLPKLPALILQNYCYYGMFENCTKIKVNDTQTGEYQTPYRIPYEGTGTNATSTTGRMFVGTGGTPLSLPTINTTYYTSNTVI